jgi:hypothetical protein
VLKMLLLSLRAFARLLYRGHWFSFIVDFFEFFYFKLFLITICVGGDEVYYALLVSNYSPTKGRVYRVQERGISTHFCPIRNSRLCSAEPISSPALNLTAFTGRKRNALPLTQGFLRSVQYLHFSESRNFTPVNQAQHRQVRSSLLMHTFDVAFATGLANDNCLARCRNKPRAENTNHPLRCRIFRPYCDSYYSIPKIVVRRL